MRERQVEEAKNSGVSIDTNVDWPLELRFGKQQASQDESRNKLCAKPGSATRRGNLGASRAKNEGTNAQVGESHRGFREPVIARRSGTVH